MTTRLTTAMKMQGGIYGSLRANATQSFKSRLPKEDELRRFGVSEHDMAILFINIFWG